MGQNLILVVDDDRAVCRALQRALSPLATPVGVRGVDEARAVLERFVVHTLLCDVDLGPGPTGHDFVAEVGVRWPRVRTFLMSGAQQVAATTLLVKPLHPEEIAIVAGAHR